MNNQTATYWIKFSPRKDNPSQTCFRSSLPQDEIEDLLYYLIWIGEELWQGEACGPTSLEQLQSEHICFLLQQYYGFELHQPCDTLVEIDLYDLWKLPTYSKDATKLHQVHVQPGLIDCVSMIMSEQLRITTCEYGSYKVEFCPSIENLTDLELPRSDRVRSHLFNHQLAPQSWSDSGDKSLLQQKKEREIKTTIDSLDALFESWLEEYGEEEMADGARFIEDTFGV